MTTEHNLFLPKEPTSAKSWAIDLRVTIIFISLCLDVSEDGLDIRDFTLTESQQARLIDIKRLLQRVQGWFETKQQAASWVSNHKISSLGDLAPLDIIKQRDKNGVQALHSYIDEKELGGFE